MRRIFCIDDEIKDNIELDSKQLEVLPTVDPDQVLWHNIGYSISDQQYRAIAAFLVQLTCTVVSIAITLYIANIQSTISAPECGEEEIEAQAAYDQQVIQTLIAIAKRTDEETQITDLQIQDMRE